jgi:hypothetical protein
LCIQKRRCQEDTCEDTDSHELRHHHSCDVVRSNFVYGLNEQENLKGERDQIRGRDERESKGYLQRLGCAGAAAHPTVSR